MSVAQLSIVRRTEAPSSSSGFAEMIADHKAILHGYLDTHLTRNHSCKTIDCELRFLEGWFTGFRVLDRGHPDRERQLFIWEAMAPLVGRQRIIEFSKGLAFAELKTRTITSYLGILRRMFQYVLEFPYIPSQTLCSPVSQSIVAKYGAIEQPVLEYDYPHHVLDNEIEGFVLTGDQLTDFYDFVRLDYLKRAQKLLPASRTYAMIVTAAESGLRADEMLHLDTFGKHRDLFYEHARIQTRFGKGTKGSGKRVRKTIFTPFAQATMKVYEERVRPQFPNARFNPALFLSETGTRLSYKAAWASLHRIVQAARSAGFNLPPVMGWHSFRGAFATNFMESNPEKVWVLMDMMGHINPSTISRYVRHSRSYFEKAIDNFVLDLIPEGES